MLDKLTRLVLAAAIAGAPVGGAMAQEALQKHAALVGDRRPALCSSKEVVALVLSVIERAAENKARGRADKARNLYEIAARLQGELCDKPGPDDAVFVRCDLGRHDLSGAGVTLLKVTAVLKSEITKGEQTFFSWSYAPVAASSGDATEAASLDRRWCTDEQPDKPIALTPDRILQVQSRLYDFGADVGPINGQLTPETLRAISAFQRWVNLPVTGELSEQTFARINSQEAPKAWATIAFDGAGNYGLGRATTRRVGEVEAVQRLRQRSNNDYKLSTTAGDSCIAIATTRWTGRSNGQRTVFTQAYTIVAESAAKARSNVVAYCEQHKGGGTCQIRDAVCAGEPTRVDPSTLPVNSSLQPREDRRAPSINSQAPTRFDSSNPLTANSPGPVQATPQE